MRESLAQLENARADQETAQRTAVALARQSFNGVLNAQARVQALQGAIDSSESAIQGNRIGVQLDTCINRRVVRGTTTFDGPAGLDQGSLRHVA